ncbi:MAG TPA: acetoacetate--CoA ligase [Kineosporiaceae bacterium]
MLPPSPPPPADDAPLWTPTASARQDSCLGAYLSWLETDRGRRFAGFADLWQWSVDDLDGFWASVWDYFGVESTHPYGCVLARREMPGAQWFPGARLNYAHHALRGPVTAPAFTGRTRSGEPDDDGRVAVHAVSQTRPPVELTFAQLRAEVARAAQALRRLGVGRGDRVVAYLPNIPETLVAFLAAASIGAVWASVAPEFGAQAVVDRFGQLEPVVLLAVGGYRYGRKDIDRRAEVQQIRAGLPTVRSVVHVPYGDHDLPGAPDWTDLLEQAGGDTGAAAPHLVFEQVPADHPLYVLFSSGTTGVPKAIVHGHGGILLEHLKNHSFSWDLRAGDRVLWFTTTAWMMWNALVSALLVRTGLVMIDGDPTYPDLGWQWQLAAETGATLLGASSGYLTACLRAGLQPARELDLSRVRQVAAAGSPLPPETSRWVHEQLGADVLINVGSGGTDVCTGIVQGSPLQPAWAGAISGPCLGVHAQAFDVDGRPVVDQLGELVITAPMPSMPVGFWGDPDGSRLRASYFDVYPGVWRHGDWIRFAADGHCVIAGRSDATLNRGGVRLGTAEFYRVVEAMPEIDDSLVVHLEDPDGGNGQLMLFVVPAAGAALDDVLRTRIRAELRNGLSPRHVPDMIEAIPVVPYNRTGKKLEVPAKRILRGEPLETVTSLESLADPHALDAFVQLARRHAAAGSGS